MSVDLTCPTCEGKGSYRCPPEVECDGHYCGRCEGLGRCPPTLDQWDALMAERNRLHRVVATYGDHTGDCHADGDLSPECECGWNHVCVRSFEFAGQEELDREGSA